MTSNYYSQQNTFNSRQSSKPNISFLNDPWVGKIVCKNYKIVRKINEGSTIVAIGLLGSFGKIYKAVHQVKGDFYAVKIESKDKKKDEETLLLEAQVIYNLKGEKGFPRLYFYMQDGENRTMTLTCEIQLGSNLDELFIKCKKRFSLKTVLIFLDQALNRLEFLHKQQYIHRDIKPENFLIGQSADDDTIYLIDFGLSMKYLDEHGKHVARKKGQPMVGTARFTPICSHQGMTQNRASDLESLGYLAVYFLKGCLPWMNIDAKTREERFQLIGQKKMLLPVESLCEGLRQEFVTFFNYVFNLAFEQEPSYPYIRKLFRKLFVDCNFQNDQKLDWHLLHQIEKTTLTERVIPRNRSSELVQQQVIIQEQNSSDEHDRSIHPNLMNESKNSKREGWLKSATMKSPIVATMVDSKGSRLKKKQSNPISMVPEPKEMMLEVMQNRQLQHNSLLSRSSEYDGMEDLLQIEGNEYHPYPPLSQMIEMLKYLRSAKRGLY